MAPYPPLPLCIWLRNQKRGLILNDLMAIALVMAAGYLLGRVTIKGLSFGTAGVLIAALIFGHFGYVVPSLIKNLGLICFVTSVGIIAGPTFFENFKKGALQYILLGVLTILIGAVTTVAVIKLAKVSTPLALGLMNGALTSTPGLAAALESTGDSLASIGYGIAYPFGVLGVVLFVQLVPRICKHDIRSEIQALERIPGYRTHQGEPQGLIIEPLGIFVFSVAVISGLLLGGITIPLGGGAQFSLGTSGGPLISGLILGHWGRNGASLLYVKKTTMETLRELGLSCFLLGAGTEAGQGFVAVLAEHGIELFLYGALITLLPMFISFWIARSLLKIQTMSALGSLCGGMTSTPALGALIAVAKSDAIATAYAATYPVALVMVVLLTQFIAILC